MSALIQIALGGALGAVFRYLAVQASLRTLGPGFPAGTMIVNVLGSFVMGLVTVYFIHRFGAARSAPFVITGVLGGFTTFSAFSFVTINLIEKGRVAAASFYVAGSVGLSVAAILAGVLLMRALLT